MGVVNTTYTFSGTDTITSSKLNNIIDDTTFTSDAIQGTTLQVVSPGKLAVSASGITSNELASNSIVTSKIADSNVTTAKIADANVTQAKLGANVVGNGPAFRAWNSTSVNVPSGTFTKLLFQTEDFDTNSNFSNSRFTATVAGYYAINGVVAWPTAATSGAINILKNGVTCAAGTLINESTTRNSVHDIVNLNVGDYVELYAAHSTGSDRITSAQSFDTYFSGCLIRSA
jgi:hypothetical protein